jgi:hypothetical protein
MKRIILVKDTYGVGFHKTVIEKLKVQVILIH